MITRTYLIHALSPLHSGTGQGVGIVDLPIARMKSTDIPIVPGSSIKGVLRDQDIAADVRAAVFGPETANASDHSGAVVIGDARLLALPVRSFVGVFAWVTSPLLLTLASRDLAEGGGAPLAIPKPRREGKRREALVTSQTGSKITHDGTVYLQDLDMTAKTDAGVDAWAAALGARLFPGNESDLLAGRLVVVDDDTMAFLWTTATQVDARNRLGADGTVEDGALWYEESLPPETLLIGLMGAIASRSSKKMTATEVLKAAVSEAGVVQLGGKATVGRGICRVQLDRAGLGDPA